MTVTDIKARIASCRDQIEHLQELLPYADHGAYGQDKARIAHLRNEIAELSLQLNTIEALDA